MSDSEAESNRDWIVFDNQQNSDSDSGASSSGFVHVGSSVVSYQRNTSQAQDAVENQADQEAEGIIPDGDKEPDDVMPVGPTETEADSVDPEADSVDPEADSVDPEADSVDPEPVDEEQCGPVIDFQPSPSVVVSESSASSSSEIEKLELPEDTEDYDISDGCQGYEYEENDALDPESVGGTRPRTGRRQSTSESDMSDIVKLEVAADEERSSEEPGTSYSRPSDLMQASAASTSSSSGSSCRFHFVQPLSVQHRYVYGPNLQDSEPVPDDVDDRCESDISGVASDENDPDLSTVSYNLDDLEIMEGDVMRSYKHKPNSSLNTLLTLLTLFTLCITIGIGFGHYLATRRIATRRDQQTVRMNELQDSYLRCLQQQQTLEAQAATSDKEKIAAVTAVWKQKYEELIIEKVDLQLAVSKLQSSDSSLLQRAKSYDPEDKAWSEGSPPGMPLPEVPLGREATIEVGSDPLDQEGFVDTALRDQSTATDVEVPDQPGDNRNQVMMADATSQPGTKRESYGQPSMSEREPCEHPSVTEESQACSTEDNEHPSVHDAVPGAREVFADIDDQASEASVELERVEQEITPSADDTTQIMTNTLADEQARQDENKGQNQPSVTGNEDHDQPSESGVVHRDTLRLLEAADEDQASVTDAEDDPESITSSEEVQYHPSMTAESIVATLPETLDEDQTSIKITAEETWSPMNEEAGQSGGIEAGQSGGIEAGQSGGIEAGQSGGIEAGQSGGIEAGESDGIEAADDGIPGMTQSTENPAQKPKSDRVTDFVSRVLNSSAMAKYQQFVNKTKQRVSKLSKKIEKTWNKVKNLTGDFLKENQAVRSLTESVYENMETIGNSLESAWNEARAKIPVGNTYHEDEDRKSEVKKPETAEVQPELHSRKPNNTKKDKKPHKKSPENRQRHTKRDHSPPHTEKSGRSLPKYSNTAAKSAKHLEHDAKHKEKRSSTMDHAQYAEYWKQAEFEPDDFFQEGFFEGNNREWRKQQRRVRKLHGRLARLNENILLAMDEDDVEDIYEDFDDVHDDLDESHLPDSLMTWLTCQVRWWKSRLFRKKSNEDLVKGCAQKLMQWQLKALCTQPCGKHDKKCKRRQRDESILQGPFCQHYQTVILPSIPQDSTDRSSGDSTKPPGQNSRQTVTVVAEPSQHMSGHVHNPYGTVHYEIDNSLPDVDHNDTDTNSGPSAEWVFERAEDRESHHHDGSWLFKRDKVRTFEREKPWYYKRSDNRAQLRSAKGDRKT